jgi:hypothetical protein
MHIDAQKNLLGVLNRSERSSLAFAITQNPFFSNADFTFT